MGGCAGILVGHPFDTVKVHLQTQDFRNPKYRSTFHCFQSIIKKESFSGLYRGMSSPLGGVAIINAIVFGVYGNVQRRMAHPESLTSHFMAGALAGLAQSFVCSPMELAKSRVQIQNSAAAYSSPLQCLLQIARTEGIRGVYRGLGITVAREMPGLGVYFVSYEMLTRTTSSEPISTLHVLLAGGLAGSISWVAIYPLDVLKSRLQVDSSGRYQGLLDCYRQSIREEGYSFLARGLNSTLLRAFPMNAATFGVVTWIFRLAGVGSPDDSGYYVAGEYELQQSSVRLQHPVAEDVWSIRLSGLWDNWDRRDKHLKGLFHWSKLMMHNRNGHFFLGQQNKGDSSTGDTPRGLVSLFINGDIKKTLGEGANDGKEIKSSEGSITKLDLSIVRPMPCLSEFQFENELEKTEETEEIEDSVLLIPEVPKEMDDAIVKSDVDKEHRTSG